MTRKFTTSLTPPRTRYADGGSHPIDPGRLSYEMFGNIPGEWLTCYMIRRFGWPNVGSDDYKNLCAWSLVTPIDGLALVVIPYLGGGGSDCNLHFSMQWTKEVGAELLRDPVLEKHWDRQERAIRRWWDREGASLYVIGSSNPEEDRLVREWGTDKNGQTYGLWLRPLGMKPQALPKKPDHMIFWALGSFLKDLHPEVLPMFKASTRRRTAFQRRAESAIKKVLVDLMRPTYVRDVSFSPAGRTVSAGSTAEPFEGAGNTPEYWFSARRKRRERKEGAA